MGQNYVGGMDAPVQDGSSMPGMTADGKMYDHSQQQYVDSQGGFEMQIKQRAQTAANE